LRSFLFTLAFDSLHNGFRFTSIDVRTDFFCLRFLQFNYGKVPLEYTREVRKDTFTGVGIKVSKDPDNGYYLVDALTKGATAFSSGIERNDKLVAINGTEIRDRPISEVGETNQPPTNQQHL
jgi:predicted metalloprotease with PDZ domain